MIYEVEQKFPVADATEFSHRLATLGVALGEATSQRDHYFNHPSRDFAVTDEAFRLRQSGERCFVTYKGPKIDAETKTRRELELPLPAGALDADAWPELLAALGFRSVAEVRKNRRKVSLKRDGFEVEIVLDDVQGVGTYCELEVQADDVQLDAAKRCITTFAADLGLAAAERRSYLELLLTKR